MTYRKVWEHGNAEYRAEALERLHELFPPHTEVRTVVVNVTRSGMGRSIMVLAQDEKGIRNVSMDVARVLGWQEDRDRGAVYVTGCGMDMCFHLVYTLSRALYVDSDGGGRAGYLLESRPLS